jgi:hypothetical protein
MAVTRHNHVNFASAAVESRLTEQAQASTKAIEREKSVAARGCDNAVQETGGRCPVYVGERLHADLL